MSNSGEQKTVVREGVCLHFRFHGYDKDYGRVWGLLPKIMQRRKAVDGTKSSSFLSWPGMSPHQDNERACGGVHTEKEVGWAPGMKTSWKNGFLFI